MPEVLAPFPAQWLTVAEFTDRETLDAYYQSAEFAEARSQLASRVSNEIQVVMQLEPIQPGVPQFPLLGEVPLREQPPAFLVLNAVGFLPDPAVPERITRFFETSGPLLLAEGTTFLATMQKVEDLEGSYAFDVLFWGELRDRAAFDKVHADPDFLEAARTLRNPSLRAFTEQSGRVAVEMAP